MPDFYQQPPVDFQGAVNQGQDYARMMARALMTKAPPEGQGTPGGAPGQMVSGHYVPPGAGNYLNQLAGSAYQGYQGQKAADAGRANDILNGGTGEAFRTPGQNFMSRFGGMFGGGGA